MGHLKDCIMFLPNHSCYSPEISLAGKILKKTWRDLRFSFKTSSTWPLIISLVRQHSSKQLELQAEMEELIIFLSVNIWITFRETNTRRLGVQVCLFVMIPANISNTKSTSLWPENSTRNTQLIQIYHQQTQKLQFTKIPNSSLKGACIG